ncbi:hypothetical protein FRB99_001136 [Tulasnella sp. 403]|nr:hypothetical protein FRB99_001136 [Tulasnella sp. 403]
MSASVSTQVFGMEDRHKSAKSGTVDGALAAVAAFRIVRGLRKPVSQPVAHGGYGDIYKGELERDGQVVEDASKVAIKALRCASNMPFAHLLLILAREMTVWSDLSHENILPFLGFEVDESKRAASLVSPWMENGDIKSYLGSRDYDRHERLLFLRDTLDGLLYLHSKGVCHGDLKAANVVVTKTRRALLCDFGVAKFMDRDSGLTTSNGFKGTWRWASPEQVNSEHCQRTIASDTWSWGMTALEIMTGQLPFNEITHLAKLIMTIGRGATPDPAQYPCLPADDPMWKIFGICWKKTPQARKSLDTIKTQVLKQSALCAPKRELIAQVGLASTKLIDGAFETPMCKPSISNLAPIPKDSSWEETLRPPGIERPVLTGINQHVDGNRLADSPDSAPRPRNYPCLVCCYSRYRPFAQISPRARLHSGLDAVEAS